MDAFRQAIMPNPSNPVILDPMDAVNVVRPLPPPPPHPHPHHPPLTPPPPLQTLTSTTLINPTAVRDAMLWH